MLQSIQPVLHLAPSKGAERSTSGKECNFSLNSALKCEHRSWTQCLANYAKRQSCMTWHHHTINGHFTSGQQYHKDHCSTCTEEKVAELLLTQQGCWNFGSKGYLQATFSVRRTLPCHADSSLTKATVSKVTASLQQQDWKSHSSMCKSSSALIARLGKARLILFKQEKRCYNSSYVLEVSMMNSQGSDKHAIITTVLQTKCSEVLTWLKEHLSDHCHVPHYTCRDATAGSYLDARKHDTPEQEEGKDAPLSDISKRQLRGTVVSVGDVHTHWSAGNDFGLHPCPFTMQQFLPRASGSQPGSTRRCCPTSRQKPKSHTKHWGRTHALNPTHPASPCMHWWLTFPNQIQNPSELITEIFALQVYYVQGITWEVPLLTVRKKVELSECALQRMQCTRYEHTEMILPSLPLLWPFWNRSYSSWCGLLRRVFPTKNTRKLINFKRSIWNYPWFACQAQV